LSLEDDAVQAIQAYAHDHQISLSKAASELIRRGIRYRLGTRVLNGIPVFDVPVDFPTVTGEHVRDLLDEE
jgi:hypothetical protein